jgi:hypothetical protein
MVLSALSFVVSSQENNKSTGYIPEVGQEGKDVVWVPTPQALVDKMLNLAKITPEDYLIDLGSGDGRTVITAAKMGIKALGIEYNPDMVALSRKNAEAEGVDKLAGFMEADIFEFDFSNATVLTMFLLPDINLRLRPKILDMKPGTRIISNTFTMQTWQYDEKDSIPGETWRKCLMWIVPAKVEGKWNIAGGGEIIFLQEFQMVSGEITINGKRETITNGKLRGNAIKFFAGGMVYEGTVDGNSMTGTASNADKSIKWTANKF